MAKINWYFFALFLSVYFACRTVVADEWRLVEEAQSKGLPQTAINHLNKIIESSALEKDHSQWLRALGVRFQEKQRIGELKPEKLISELKSIHDSAPDEVKPLLMSVLANWYSDYYFRNRWQIMQRTEVKGEDSDDLGTWDLKRIYREIDHCYSQAIINPPLLKSIPISNFKGFLVEGTMPVKVRPTLYDFIAQEALNFYASINQAGARPEDYFEIDADSPAFGSLDEFLRYIPQTTNSDSPKVKAIKLYQSLLAQHRKDRNFEALIDLEISRIQFMKNNAYGDNVKANYTRELEALVSAYPHNSATALAGYNLARAYGETGDKLRAYKTAQTWFEKFPESIGGKSCFSYQKQLEEKFLSLSVPRVVSPNAAKLKMTYRNITKIYFRVFRVDWKRFMKTPWRYPGSLETEEVNEMLHLPPVKDWKVELTPTADYKDKVVTHDLPALLPGEYRIFASSDAQFLNSTMLQIADYTVADFSSVYWVEGKTVKGVVADAASGGPLSQVTVKSLNNSNKEGKWEYGESAVTDTEGRFALNFRGEQYGLYLLFEHKGQTLLDTQNVWRSRESSLKKHEQVVFFTDRSLYRPGQVLHYKGILFSIDEELNHYEVVSEKPLTIILRDTNGKEVTRESLVTNSLGSVSGSITLPTNTLSGRMSLVAENLEGTVYISVEEYKRPKFLVTIEQPARTYQLGDSVEVSAAAFAYTGAPIDGAQVRYQVRRSLNFASEPGSYAFGRVPDSNAQMIAHGSTRTSNKGDFNLTFVAKPDKAVDPQRNPTFIFEVEATVVGSDGEVRTGELAIPLGYTSRVLELKAPELIIDEQPFDLAIAVYNRAGIAQSFGSVDLKVWVLKQPESPIADDSFHVSSTNGSSSNYNAGRQPSSTEQKGDWRLWAQDRLLWEKRITSSSTPITLSQGFYRLEAVEKGESGQINRTELPLLVAPGWGSRKFPLAIPSFVALSSANAKPGEKVKLLWGTGFPAGRALVIVQSRTQEVLRFWSNPGVTQQSFEIPVSAAYRGGFGIHVLQIKDHRAYTYSLPVSVPWDNKDLTIKADSFRDKLEPGSKESWKFSIKGEGKELVAAEMAAGLYDSSLDQALPHSWNKFSFFSRGYERINFRFINHLVTFHWNTNNWNQSRMTPAISYPSFPETIAHLDFFRRKRDVVYSPVPAPGLRPSRLSADSYSPEEPTAMEEDKQGSAEQKEKKGVSKAGRTGKPEPDLSNVPLRSNFEETAFFYPHLQFSSDGTTTVSFSVPETLTKWKFLGVAHGAQGENGVISLYTVTQKALMVQPNSPRFLREGDDIWLNAKVTNMLDEPQKGVVQLAIIPLDPIAQHQNKFEAEKSFPSQEFFLKAGESQSFFWKLEVPKKVASLRYQVAARSEQATDGETDALIVLPSRVYQQESEQLWLRRAGKKQFEISTLGQLGDSQTLSPEKLVIQVASNPVWAAIRALPYLMEFPYECSEQVFNRYYANTLAAHIVSSNPRIAENLEKWRAGGKLGSPLEKDQHLKNLALEETPWVTDAQSESGAQARIWSLLAPEKVAEARRGALTRLGNGQLQNGAWSWFPGGVPDNYITTYVVSGFGRLRALGVETEVDLAFKAIKYLDGEVLKRYARVKKSTENHLTHELAFYLYARTFFINDVPFGDKEKKAFDFFVSQARKYWVKLDSPLSQGYVALALHRLGSLTVPEEILRSLVERSESSEELGMYWPDNHSSWLWTHAPIETQSLLIELLSVVGQDDRQVEEAKVWLLKQKQVQSWNSTKATADAVHALFLTGSDLFRENGFVDVEVGERKIHPLEVELGTGFYEVSLPGNQLTRKDALITLSRQHDGLAWGGAYFQYFEELSKIRDNASSGISIDKEVFVDRLTKDSVVLHPVDGPISVGDTVTVRLVIKTDRDLEYIHVKDGRAAGVEPVNVLSGYRYLDGLSVYEQTKDSAQHYFISMLPRGKYVIEYKLNVQLAGHFQTGIAEIQSMYAPQFKANSSGRWLDVERK